MRRSTGGNSRESEEESAITEQKIHHILEQAKQEAERQRQLPLAGFQRVPTEAVPLNQSEVLIDPKTGQAVRITNPTSSVTLTLVTNSQSQSPESRGPQVVAKAGIPQPTVLPPRNDTVRPSQTRVVPAPATQVSRPTPQVTQVAPPPRQALPIQLPTQPLPPESVRKTQPVLLEQNKVSQASTNLPRSVTLPTEPVPMSTMATSKMPSLPRTPLPMTTAQASHMACHVPGHVVVKIGRAHV